IKARDAEQSLLGNPLDDASIHAAADLAAAAAQPTSDTRGPAEYKRDMVRTSRFARCVKRLPVLQEVNSMSTHHITVTINGTPYEGDVDSRTLLVHWIRDTLRLTGTHIGCDTTSCGACTILVDGKATKSCTMFAVQADGRQLMTVEGLEQNDKIHPLQEGFHEEHALQCGYCTPGMMMTSLALLQRNPNPTEHEIRVGISGNLC